MRIEHPQVYRTQFLGRAGEHAVASQLLLRGMPVDFPSVDTGYDLVASGIKIQVKSTNTKRRDGYVFSSVGSRPRNSLGMRDYSFRDWCKDSQFVVCWAAPANRFWIMPTKVITEYKVTIISVGFDKRWTVDHDEIHRLYQGGMRQFEIADLLGCSKCTVSASLNGRRPKSPSLSNDSARYENAWDLIESAIGLPNLSQIPGVITPK